MTTENPVNYAIDFETYYDGIYTLKTLGVQRYVYDDRFDAYMVSVVGDDGSEFCGHPSEFDFESIAGGTWVAHNKGFDWEVYQRLIRDGVVADVDPEWYCTADMSAFFALPRKLDQAAKFLWGVELTKSIRDNMVGRRWVDLREDERAELLEYCLIDSRTTLRLWQELSGEWPEHERDLSNRTIHMRRRGFPVDVEKIDESIKTLSTGLWLAEENIPWWDGPTKTNKTPNSPKKLAEQCRKDGIEVPSSRAKTSAVAEEWVAKYGDRFPYVRAMQLWGSLGKMRTQLSSMRERAVEREGWHWMPYGLRSPGTHTLRDAGTEKFNVLNMNKFPLEFDLPGQSKGVVDLRSHLVPPPGYVFVSADYSQIEPRVLAWLVQDVPFLDAVRSGVDPYVAFGTTTLGHVGEWDSVIRSLWKVMVLQLGYGSGWVKFQEVAKGYGVFLTKEEAVDQVTLYRQRNPLVAGKPGGLWHRLEEDMRSALPFRGGNGCYSIELPSGRFMYYRNVNILKGLQATVAEENVFRETNFYGGKLTENLVQAVARDVFVEGYLGLERRSIPVVLRIYDEFLVLARIEEAEHVKQQVLEVMTTTPDWMPGLPLAAEADIIEYYKK